MACFNPKLTFGFVVNPLSNRRDNGGISHIKPFRYEPRSGTHKELSPPALLRSRGLVGYSLFEVGPMSGFHPCSSVMSGKKARLEGVGVCRASGDEVSVGGYVNDWVGKVKDVWQVMDSHLYLRDIVVPVAGTLTATLMAWVVFPWVLKRIHKYSTKGTSALLRRSLRDVEIPYEKTSLRDVEIRDVEIPYEKTSLLDVEIPYVKTSLRDVDIPYEKEKTSLREVEISYEKTSLLDVEIPYEKTSLREVEIPYEKTSLRDVEIPYEKTSLRDVEIPYEKTIWGAMEDLVRYLVTFSAFLEICYLAAPDVVAELKGQTWEDAPVLSFVWFLHKWKTNLVDRAKNVQSLDRETLILIDRVASVGLFIIAAMALAEEGGVTVESFLTVGGIGGVATAFASKDIRGNVLSSLSKQFSKPFSLGDTTKPGSVEGKVVETGLTNTSLLNAEKFPVIVPNSTFSSQVIVNNSRGQ